ncbi:MAG: lytic murein transglycosylase [Bacteroidetes bacterium]|nr:lytic murein transglycosylase [Bacteroidota bacterium]
MCKCHNIYKQIFIFCSLTFSFTCTHAQREAQEVRYGSRWQVKMLKDKYSYDLVVPTEKERQTYQSLLKNNQVTVQFVENMLITNGLPKMLRNLVMIESGFRNSSVSSANAVGIWQITPIHAENYGLMEKDRANVYESTRIAIKSLKELYSKYGNWVKVIAAYNCGAANLDRAIARGRSDKYHIFYKYLPDETINHVNKFMTACYITNELEELMNDYHGVAVEEKPQASPPKTTTNYNDPTLVSTQINSEFNLDVLGEQIKVANEVLVKWNPNLAADLAKYGKGTLYLPISYMGEFMAKKSTIMRKSNLIKK